MKLHHSFVNTLYMYKYVYIHTPSHISYILTHIIQYVSLAAEPGISLIISPQTRILRTTDTFLFISHTTNVLLFKFRCNIFIAVRIIKEIPGSVASGTQCIMDSYICVYVCVVCARARLWLVIRVFEYGQRRLFLLNILWIFRYQLHVLAFYRHLQAEHLCLRSAWRCLLKSRNM